jgi:hypothetical protein
MPVIQLVEVHKSYLVLSCSSWARPPPVRRSCRDELRYRLRPSATQRISFDANKCFIEY